MKHVIQIILTSIVLAIVYGIIHDLITANVCVEYFTIGHPKLIESESPVRLALLWGFIATWWVGLILGILIVLVSRIGDRPRFELMDVIKPMLLLLGVMAIMAFVSGIFGFFAAKNELFYLTEPLASMIPEERHHLFLSAAWAHGASYLTGFVGCGIVCFRIWRRRGEVN
jgi:hypothetical protein